VLLVITNSLDVTADYLCKKIASASISVTRINSDQIDSKCSVLFKDLKPQISWNSAPFFADDISSVWFRRPKPIVIPKKGIDESESLNIQAEWSEAIEGFLSHIPASKWINYPSANVGASHKIEQLSRAQKFGLKTPFTIVTQDIKELAAFWNQCSGKVIIKPLASGYLERDFTGDDTLIYTNLIKKEHLNSESLGNCPCLFQEAVEKVVDVRVTVVDNDLHAVSLSAADNGVQRLDIRRYNMSDVRYQNCFIPEKVSAQLLKYLQSYGLRFAAVDFVIDKNDDWLFLEINPNGQWAWLDLAGVTDIAGSFIKAFKCEC